MLKIKQLFIIKERDMLAQFYFIKIKMDILFFMVDW